ncbi:MAG: lipid A deacylase LpxR family protein [Gammaproteobacteria bacterium]
MNTFRFALIALLLSLLSPAHANDQGIGIYFDQDFLIPARNEDRDYTMGVAVEYFRDQDSADVPLLDWAHDSLDGWLRPGTDADGTRLRRGIMLGSTTFTPDDIANPNPIVTDRPYASIFYVSLKRVKASDDLAVGTDLQLGLLGLNLANEFQTWVHGRYRDIEGGDEPVDPRGWGHQISDGGEPTARYRFSVSQKLWEQRDRWDVSANGGFALGYQTNAHLGMSARLGWLKSEFWTLPYDPINRGNALPSTHEDFELYVWGAFRARAVAYDAMLQGQFKHSDVTVASSDIKRLVHEAGIGATIGWGHLAFTAALNAKTGEMEGTVDRTHVWGGLYLNARF